MCIYSYCINREIVKSNSLHLNFLSLTQTTQKKKKKKKNQFKVEMILFYGFEKWLNCEQFGIKKIYMIVFVSVSYNEIFQVNPIRINQ